MKRVGTASPGSIQGQAPGSSWVRQSQAVPQKNPGLLQSSATKRNQVLRNSVHGLGRLGPGVPRVGFNLEWILGSS